MAAVFGVGTRLDIPQAQARGALLRSGSDGFGRGLRLCDVAKQGTPIEWLWSSHGGRGRGLGIFGEIAEQGARVQFLF